MNNKIELFKKSLFDRRIAVVGIGISNLPLICFLSKNGAVVTACDKKQVSELGEKTVKELMELGVTLNLGDTYLENLEQEIIFKTPGMRCDVPQLKSAQDNGSIVTSEMELFFDLCPAQIIAVTGSDGKTTTTTLIYKILQESGYNCHLGGNIGYPLIGNIDDIQPQDKVILELSSFQLQTMKTSPHIAVITNISPNHLDWHTSMQEYIDAKKNIFMHQNSEGVVVLNHDNAITRSLASEVKGNVVLFSRVNYINSGIKLNGCKIEALFNNETQTVLSTDDIILPGIHNVENYMAAIATVWGMVDTAIIRKVAMEFVGVPHRIELVRELDGVRYYNDSIASSPSRTAAGLNSFNKRVILIAGGYDKKIPFDGLGALIREKVKHLILIGKTADKIKEAVLASYHENEIPISIDICTSLEDASNMAREVSVSGDIVTLSPACASFDMFENFEDRGNNFKNIVNSWK